MNGIVHDELQHALTLTIAMSEAAAHDNWALVVELDARRQVHLQHMRRGDLDAQHRDALAALQAHNRALLERAEQVRDAVERQISQHQYNHRALRTYVSSTR